MFGEDRTFFTQVLLNFFCGVSAALGLNLLFFNFWTVKDFWGYIENAMYSM